MHFVQDDRGGAACCLVPKWSEHSFRSPVITRPRNAVAYANIARMRRHQDDKRDKTLRGPVIAFWLRCAQRWRVTQLNCRISTANAQLVHDGRQRPIYHQTPSSHRSHARPIAARVACRLRPTHSRHGSRGRGR